MSPLSGMSVRAKATWAAAGTVAFAIALCMVALVLALQQNLRASAEADAEQAAVSIESQLTRSEKTASGVVVAAPAGVTVKDSSGRVVASSPTTPGIRRNDGDASSRTAIGEAPYSVDVAPLTTALHNVTRLLLRQVVPATAGLVLFVAALTWLLVGRALRPVAAIREEFTEITERDLHRRVPVPEARDEIFRLARTMNATLDRLYRAMNRHRQFVADASHELRSPIAAVRTQLELALARPSRTDWPTVVYKALQDTERLQAVASDLLLLARLDAREAPPRSPVDLMALAAEEARRHPGTVVVCADQSEGNARPAAVVQGSRVQLSRLLTNLTDNARRHTRTTVVIAVAARDDIVELSVDDDGPGIPAPDRERVFERFTRLDGARARQDGGTGLGLAIAKDIAHAHGGTLTLHTSPRGGVRALLRLPRRESA